MSLNKQELDRYITSTPDTGFDTYVERIIEEIPDAVYALDEDWFTNGQEVCNDWLNKFFSWGLPIKEAAIEIVNIFWLIHKL